MTTPATPAIDYDALAKQNGGTVDYSAVARDPDFLKASTADQLSYLSHVDPDFAKAAPSDKLAYLNHIKSVTTPPATDYDSLARAHGAVNMPPLPPGYTLDAAPSTPPLPAGYTLDAPASSPSPQVTMGPRQPDSLWDMIKKWTLHPFDTAAEKLAVSPSELTTNPIRARAQEIVQNAGQLADVYNKESGLLLAPDAAIGAMGMAGDALDAYRASRAAKLAQDPDEWRRINAVLGVPNSGIRISPSATSVADAATMPGRTVAQLGYTAKTLGNMEPIERMNLLDSHLQSAGQAIQNTTSASTKSGTTLDVGESAMSVFKGIKDPVMQKKMIDQFNSTAKELGVTDLRKATPEQALALRRALRAGKAFSGFSDIQTTANISKQLGSAVSANLKAAVPDFSQLDQAYSDLKQGVNAARAQVQAGLTQAPQPGFVGRIAQNAASEFRRNPVRTGAYALGGAGGAAYGVDRLLRLRILRGDQ